MGYREPCHHNHIMFNQNNQGLSRTDPIAYGLIKDKSDLRTACMWIYVILVTCDRITLFRAVILYTCDAIILVTCDTVTLPGNWPQHNWSQR